MRAVHAVHKIEAGGAVETMEPPVPQFPQRDDCYEINNKLTDERVRRVA